MQDDTLQEPNIQEADIVSDADIAEATSTPVVSTPTSPPPSETSSEVDVLLNLEHMIRMNILGIEKRRDDMKQFKQMLNDALINDPDFAEVDEKTKAATKEKSAIKQQILRRPGVSDTARKVADLTSEIKEMDNALSDYLREYQRLSGATEIEIQDGETREIVYTAKLIRKSTK